MAKFTGEDAFEQSEAWITRQRAAASKNNQVFRIHARIRSKDKNGVTFVRIRCSCSPQRKPPKVAAEWRLEDFIEIACAPET